MGSYTLRQLILYTKKKYQTRFEYLKRDVLKTIEVKQVLELKFGSLESKTYKYVVKTYSYPQYQPYLGKKNRQKKIKHEYDQYLEMTNLNLDSTDWKYRIGTEKKVPTNLPWTKIKSIPREVMKKWKSELEDKKSEASEDEKIKLDKKFKTKIENHRKKAKFLSDGDYIARVLGINLDFYYRSMTAFKASGHLFGRDFYNKIDPRHKIPFCNKHMLRLLDVLIRKGVLK